MEKLAFGNCVPISGTQVREGKKMVKLLKKGSILGTPKQFVIFTAVVITIAFLCYWWLGDVHQTLAVTIF